VQGAVLNDDVTVLLMRSAGRHGGAGFLARLWAQVRFLGQVVTFRKDVPWPEWSRRNIGGAVGLGNK